MQRKLCCPMDGLRKGPSRHGASDASAWVGGTDEGSATTAGLCRGCGCPGKLPSDVDAPWWHAQGLGAFDCSK